MTNNLKLAGSLVWACCALLAGALTAVSFMFFVDQDSWGPEGFTEGFSIAEIPLETSTENVLSTIEGQASSTGVNVYKISPFADEHTDGRNYHVFIGDEATVLGDLAQATFPTFSLETYAAIYPAQQLSRDGLLGSYTVQGDAQVSQGFVDGLAQQGVVAQPVSSIQGHLIWPFFVAGSPWGAAITILWLALVLAMFNQSSTRLAIVGLRRSSGETSWRIARSEAAAVLLPALCTAAVMPLVLGVYSLGWVSGYQFRSILLVAIFQAIIPISAALLVLLIAWFFARKTPTGQILTGARPTTTLSALSILAIVVTSLSATLSAGSVIRTVLDEQHAQKADAYRAAHPELVNPALGYAILGSDQDKIDNKLAQIYRHMEAEHRVFLTDANVLEGDLPVNPEPWQEDMMLVNTNFLGSLPQITTGQVEEIAALTQQPGGVAVLLPTELSKHEPAVRELVTAWAQTQAALDGNTTSPELNLTVLTVDDLGVIPRLDYDDSGEPMHVVDPVLIVTDAPSGVMHPLNYAYVGTYTDAGHYQQSLEEHQVAHSIVALEHVSQRSALDRAERQAELHITLVGAAVMMIALVLGTASFAAVHHARHRTRVFLLTSTGQHYAKIHGKFIVLTGLLALLPALIGLLQNQVGPIYNTLIITSCVVVVVATTALTLKLLDASVTRSALEIS